MDSHWMQYN